MFNQNDTYLKQLDQKLAVCKVLNMMHRQQNIRSVMKKISAALPPRGAYKAELR